MHGDKRKFQIHPLILKYCRIYRWQAEQKELDLQLYGSSYGYCRYNPQAIGAVVQGFLDNMVKYAPAGSNATIVFQEEAESITIDFTSLGPRIEDDESQKIFLPSFRARAARGTASSGLGLDSLQLSKSQMPLTSSYNSSKRPEKIPNITVVTQRPFVSR